MLFYSEFEEASGGFNNNAVGLSRASSTLLRFLYANSQYRTVNNTLKGV